MKKTGVLVLGVLIVMANTGLIFAHEKRMVVNKYEFIVGFLNEPAFSGQINGLDLRISKGEKPVEGLEEKLKVTVMRDDQQKSFNLKLGKKYNEPGRYAGYFLPTQPGKYIFRIQGDINGVAVDEKFESGGKFHDVEDVDALKFP